MERMPSWGGLVKKIGMSLGLASGLIYLSGCAAGSLNGKYGFGQVPRQSTGPTLSEAAGDFITLPLQAADNLAKGKFFGGGSQQTVVVQQPQQVQQLAPNIYGSQQLQGWPGWQYIQNPIFGNVLMAAGSNFVDLDGDRAVSPGELKNMSNTFPLKCGFYLACRFDKIAKNITIYGYNDAGNLRLTLPQSNENGANSLVTQLNMKAESSTTATFVVKGYLIKPQPRLKGFGSTGPESQYTTEHVIGTLQLNFQ